MLLDGGIAIQIANAPFAARNTELWGQGSTAVASDSTHVRAYDQNLSAGGRRGGRLPTARPGAEQPDPPGTHRPEVGRAQKTIFVARVTFSGRARRA
ncbi:hypothetical protein ACFY0R_36900 [Streptomyces sp. NPDC001633]|uniref:hypothetical protein n=1 Tax=Streptomyces sp. NPDC001633 TaxID=3364595 RepID=UPI0036AE2962